MSNTELSQLREQLRERRAKGELGVVAARAHVFEWVLRDWCDNPNHIPNRNEVSAIQDALAKRAVRLADNAAPLVGAGNVDGNYISDGTILDENS